MLTPRNRANERARARTGSLSSLAGADAERLDGSGTFSTAQDAADHLTEVGATVWKGNRHWHVTVPGRMNVLEFDEPGLIEFARKCIPAIAIPIDEVLADDIAKRAKGER